LIQWYDSDGVTILPAEAVLSTVLAGAADTPKKLGIKSVGTAPTGPIRIAIDQEGESDGYLMLRLGLDGASVGSPSGLAVSVGPAGGGGTWASVGTRGWAVTAGTAAGESPAGFTVNGHVGGG